MRPTFKETTSRKNFQPNFSRKNHDYQKHPRPNLMHPIISISFIKSPICHSIAIVFEVITYFSIHSHLKSNEKSSKKPLAFSEKRRKKHLTTNYRYLIYELSVISVLLLSLFSSQYSI